MANDIINTMITTTNANNARQTPRNPHETKPVIVNLLVTLPSYSN